MVKLNICQIWKKKVFKKKKWLAVDEQSKLNDNLFIFSKNVKNQQIFNERAQSFCNEHCC